MNAFFCLCQARVYQGCQHCRDSCTFLCTLHTLSTLHSLPLAVLPAAEREGEGNSLPHHLFLRWVGRGPMDGAGRCPHSMGQAGTPVTWGRPGFPGHGTGRHPGDMGQARAPVDSAGQDAEH